MSASSSAARLVPPRRIASAKGASPLVTSSSVRACSFGSLPESCQAYSAWSASSRARRLAVFMQPRLQPRHLHRYAHRLGALVEPRQRLLLVLGRADAVRDGNAEVESHAP